MKAIFVLIFILFNSIIYAQRFENIIIVTIDGVRWQEVFGGIDTNMVNEQKNKHAYLKYKTLEKDAPHKVLTSFLQNTIAKEGLLWGDRKSNSFVEVKNPYWFSYPGYNEIFTGTTDSTINSNNKIYNHQVTILEELSKKDDYKNKIAVFGSWDRFRYIFNDERSGILVNDGYRNLEGNLNDRQQYLNQLQHVLPDLFHGAERLDYITFHHAFEYLKKEHPKVLVIALGDTDEFAHSGQYDLYIDALYQADKWLEELWNYIQSNEPYKNKTSLIITTDHGRGAIQDDAWRHHGNGTKGSNEVWIGAIGPITNKMEKKEINYLVEIVDWIKYTLK